MLKYDKERWRSAARPGTCARLAPRSPVCRLMQAPQSSIRNPSTHARQALLLADCASVARGGSLLAMLSLPRHRSSSSRHNFGEGPPQHARPHRNVASLLSATVYFLKRIFAVTATRGPSPVSPCACPPILQPLSNTAGHARARSRTGPIAKRPDDQSSMCVSMQQCSCNSSNTAAGTATLLADMRHDAAQDPTSLHAAR